MGPAERCQAAENRGSSILESVIFRLAEEAVRPYTGDIRHHLTTWAQATGREMREGVVFFGTRLDLLRFFPGEVLPVTHHPLVMVVAGDELAQVLDALGQVRCEEICVTVAAPETDGGIRVLVPMAGMNKIVIIRIYPRTAAV